MSRRNRRGSRLDPQHSRLANLLYNRRNRRQDYEDTVSLRIFRPGTPQANPKLDRIVADHANSSNFQNKLTRFHFYNNLSAIKQGYVQAKHNRQQVLGLFNQQDMPALNQAVRASSHLSYGYMQDWSGDPEDPDDPVIQTLDEHLNDLDFVEQRLDVYMPRVLEFTLEEER